MATKYILFLIYLLYFSNLWKVVEICPLLNEDVSCKIINYRPIYMLPNNAKRFEMFLHQKVFRFG